MAASARLRSSARQRASEKHDALALHEESRRLQTARAEQARRVRLAKQKIARYREKRLVELESRLARRSGTRPPDIRRPMSVPEEERHRDDDGCIGEGAVKNAENTIYENPPRSKQRRSIEAAISASMAGSSDIEKQPRFGFEREPTGAAEVEIQREETRPQGYERNQPWGIDLNREDSPPLHEHPSVDVRDCPARPLGRPPLAPSRAAQTRKLSIRKQSSVGGGDRSAAETGGVAEEYGWDDEYDEYDDAEEVQTETASGGSGNEGELWGHDGGSEESVREESAIAREWGGDLGAEEVSIPVEDVRMGDALQPRGSHRRHRNWIGSEREGDGSINAANNRLLREKVAESTNTVPRGEVPRVGSASAGRSGLRTENDPRPSPVARLLDAVEIVQPAVTLEGYGGDRSRDIGSGRWPEPDEGRGSAVGAIHGRSDTGKSKNPANSVESGTRKIKRRGGSDGDNSGGRIDSPNRGFGRSVDRRAHHGPLGGPGTHCEGGDAELFNATEVREESRAQTGDHQLGGEAGRVENGGVLGGRDDDRHYAAEGTLWGNGRRATGNFGSSRGEEPDDDGSYESRWSLSEEDEARGQGAAWRVDAEGYHDGSIGEAAQKERKAVGHGRGEASSGFEASEGANRDGSVAATVPEYQDDFSDNSARRSQGTINSFAVSSPSDEKPEGFAPVHIGAKPSAPNPEVGPPPDSPRENIAVDGWLVNEPPPSKAPGGLLEDASGSRGLRRPISIGGNKPDVRPASPRVPRFNSQGTAERERFHPSVAEASSERVEPSTASPALLQAPAVRREDAASTATATESRPRFHRPAENDHSRITDGSFPGNSSQTRGDLPLAVNSTFRKEKTGGGYPHGGRAAAEEHVRPSLAATEPPRNDEIYQGGYEQGGHQDAFRESDDWPEHPVSNTAAGATAGATVGATTGATTARSSAAVAKQTPTELHSRSIEYEDAQARRGQASLRGEISPYDAALRTAAARSSPMDGDLDDDDSIGATRRSKTLLPALLSDGDAVGTGMAVDATKHGISSTSTFALSDSGTETLGDRVSSTVSLDIKLPPEIHRSRDDFDVGHTAAGDSSIENRLKSSSSLIDPQVVSTDSDAPFLAIGESESSLLSGAGQSLKVDGSGDISSKSLDSTLSFLSVPLDAGPDSSADGPPTSQLTGTETLEGGQVGGNYAGNAPLESTSSLPSMPSSSGRASPRTNRFASSAVGASVQKAPVASTVYADGGYRRSSLEEGGSNGVRLVEGSLVTGGLSRSGSSLDIEGGGGGGSNDDDDGYF